MSTNSIPSDHHTLTPVLIEGAQKTIDFLKATFGAKERFLMKGDAGKVAHAEFQVGDSVVMLSDASPQWKARGGAIYVYVEDVDAAYQRALQAGATSLMEPANQFWGDRHAGVEDPTGIYWGIATRVEEVSPEELARRAEKYAKECSAS
jgi:uncharacterized glyoxalase superfamily protein PhnB